jgi:hypothetical protein
MKMSKWLTVLESIMNVVLEDGGTNINIDIQPDYQNINVNINISKIKTEEPETDWLDEYDDAIDEALDTLVEKEPTLYETENGSFYSAEDLPTTDEVMEALYGNNDTWGEDANEEISTDEMFENNELLEDVNIRKMREYQRNRKYAEQTIKDWKELVISDARVYFHELDRQLGTDHSHIIDNIGDELKSKIQHIIHHAPMHEGMTDVLTFFMKEGIIDINGHVVNNITSMKLN